MGQFIPPSTRREIYESFKRLCLLERQMGQTLLKLLAHSEPEAMAILAEHAPKYRQVIEERRQLIRTLQSVPDLQYGYYSIDSLIRQRIWE